jgi:hypothetical protein
MNPAVLDQIRTLKFEHINIDEVWADAELAAIKAQREKLNGSHEPPRFCECPETLVNGRRVSIATHPGGAHDCRYSQARSALTSEAARIATEKIGDLTDDSQHGYDWVRIFAKEMERLAAPLLRQSSSNGTHEQKAV